MILLNGVSGSNNETLVDGVEFKRISYYIIKKNRGRVLSFIEPETGTNYYKVKVQIFGEQLYILLNISYPFLAFASSVEPGEILFVDYPLLKEELISYYRILTIHELNEPLIVKQVKGKSLVENENQLNEADLYGIKHWKTQTIGEVVFNFWD
ncbi:hypothetical protein [Sutcliffiella halmapala]|uniref:hypothetical protein n=1 Tax=Sutcliffiella halmapala TaxID=79882 RepID=UPI0009953BB8|nr:hypothetical protein [Sutcliffiella halmapala]